MLGNVVYHWLRQIAGHLCHVLLLQLHYTISRFQDIHGEHTAEEGLCLKSLRQMIQAVSWLINCGMPEAFTAAKKEFVEVQHEVSKP